MTRTDVWRRFQTQAPMPLGLTKAATRTKFGTAYVTGGTQNDASRKCKELSIGEDINGHIDNALHNFKNCFLAHMENFRHTVAGNSCSDEALKIQECDNYIVKNITACGSADAQYFPKMVFSAISDYAGYVCINAQKYRLQILLDHKTCFPSLAYGINCFENFRFFNSSAIISREEMCSDQNEVQDCFKNYVNQTCPIDSAFLHILNDTFKYNEPPCIGGTARVNVYNMIFFIVTIVITCLK